MIALSVMLEVDPAHADAFAALVLRQAHNSLTNEKGCLGFTVFRHDAAPNRFYLHETYANKEALEKDHRSTPYFAEFIEKTTPWVLSASREIWHHLEG